MRFSLRALSALAAAALLVGCGTTPPTGVSPSPTPSSATPSSSHSSVAPSSPTPSATTSASSTASTTPAANTIVLQGKGISNGAFGSPEDDVEGILTSKVGKADDSYAGPVCELDSATAYGRQLLYGGVAFLFQSKAKGTKNSARTFSSWVLTLDQQLPKSLKLADGYPVDTTFAKLKDQFPKGKSEVIALGDSVIHIYTTPSGIWYRGDDANTPTVVGAGPMGTCE